MDVTRTSLQQTSFPFQDSCGTYTTSSPSFAGDPTENRAADPDELVRALDYVFEGSQASNDPTAGWASKRAAPKTIARGSLKEESIRIAILILQAYETRKSSLEILREEKRGVGKKTTNTTSSSY